MHRHTWNYPFLDNSFTGCGCGALRHYQDPEHLPDGKVNHERRRTVTEPDGKVRYYFGTRQTSMTRYYDSFKKPPVRKEGSMTVKEMIERLSTEDADMRVVVLDQNSDQREADVELHTGAKGEYVLAVVERYQPTG